MSSTFEANLQNISQKLRHSRKDVISYSKNAQAIQNYLIRKMKHFTEFKNAFRGLISENYNCVDFDEFNIQIKLAMPFPLVPEVDTQRLGFVFLKASGYRGYGHRLIKDNYVNRKYLQVWIREILQHIIGDGITITCGLHKYELNYPNNARGYAMAHTILATDVFNRKQNITINILMVFEFERNMLPIPPSKVLSSNDERNWVVVPQGKAPKDSTCSRTFMVWAPHLEHELLKDKRNLKNSLRLMKAIRDTNDMPHLTSFMLKSIYLLELDKRNEQFWERSMGAILIAMIHRVLEYLNEAYLPFYWQPELNHFDSLSGEDIKNYKYILNAVLNELKSFRQISQNKYYDLERLFGL